MFVDLFLQIFELCAQKITEVGASSFSSIGSKDRWGVMNITCSELLIEADVLCKLRN